jgi:hypothetical protein
LFVVFSPVNGVEYRTVFREGDALFWNTFQRILGIWQIPLVKGCDPMSHKGTLFFTIVIPANYWNLMSYSTPPGSGAGAGGRSASRWSENTDNMMARAGASSQGASARPPACAAS